MDRIIITDLHARCIVGVNADERREKQDVTINLSIYADFSTPGRTDRFEDAVDYRAIKKRVLGLVENSKYFLLEALTEAIANVCLATPGIVKVRVRVDKPSALRFARSVGVEIMRARAVTPERVFVAVGSNIDPPVNVRAAIRGLALHTCIVAMSTVYRTEPEGRSGQPSFYNCVVEVRTEMRPQEFKFQVLRRIEADLGRQRTADKYAPRTIDLDLILYGDLVLVTSDLVLPDPQIAHRPFLAVPLSELAPDLKLPGTTSKMAELAAKLPSDKLRPLTAYTSRLRTDIKGAFHTRCEKA